MFYYLAIRRYISYTKKYAGMLAGVLILAVYLTGCGLIPTSTTQARPIQSATPESIEQSNLMATSEALQTQIEDIDPIASAAAFATEQASSKPTDLANARETETALQATPSPTQERTGPNGEPVPQDIPFPESYISDFYSSRNFISYFTTFDISSLTQYYIANMQPFGWKISEAGTYISETDAQLVFEKPESIATILFRQNPLSEQISVVITVQVK